MITPRQIRAARALLNWTQKELADRALVSENSIYLLERGEVDARTSTVTQIQKALEAGGIEFLPGEGLKPKAGGRRRKK